uniref:Uncharacterized protein n=1 Tax=Ovis aries TaxID=9940 RepID=A0AC11CKQ0_SHEEP
GSEGAAGRDTRGGGARLCVHPGLSPPDLGVVPLPAEGTAARGRPRGPSEAARRVPAHSARRGSQDAPREAGAVPPDARRTSGRNRRSWRPRAARDPKPPVRTWDGLPGPQFQDNEAPLCLPHRSLDPLPDSTRALNFERPCYLRGGICLKQGTPSCEPFRGPCRAFTVCCKIKPS